MMETGWNFKLCSSVFNEAKKALLFVYHVYPEKGCPDICDIKCMNLRYLDSLDSVKDENLKCILFQQDKWSRNYYFLVNENRIQNDMLTSQFLQFKFLKSALCIFSRFILDVNVAFLIVVCIIRRV